MSAKHDLVLLMSGGYDSVLLLHMALHANYNPLCVLIDYGQKHKRELEKAQKLCQTKGVNYKIVTVVLDVDSGLTGNRIGGTYAGVHEMHMPGRNTIFVGLALSIAESVGATKIWYGANMEDRINKFPDCEQEWIYAMNQALKIAGSYPVELEAPLLGMRRVTILRLGCAYHNIALEDTHSGYEV